MTEAAVRSRLLELRRTHERAAHGRELLDQKREVILRALAAASADYDKARAALGDAVDRAAARLTDAIVEAGVHAVETAALAQPPIAGVACSGCRIAGVAALELTADFPPFHARYGLDGTTASLEGAGAAYSAALPLVVEVAQHGLAVRRLHHALRETTRRLKALEKIVLPQLERTLHEVASAIEEDERTDGLQRKLWLRRAGKHVGAVP